MQKIVQYPKKLHPGGHVRVIAPSRSLALIREETRDIATRNFADIGLSLSFGKHVLEKDDSWSSSIESRLADLHDAFADQTVNAVFSVIGGWNCNELLSQINWQIIARNPKIFCGFSDITALGNAIFAKTGVVTYSGPHYSTLGQKKELEYTLEYLKRCLFEEASFVLESSSTWTDDLWFLDQENRVIEKGAGFWPVCEGVARGTILGGNLGTLRLLVGTPYFPEVENCILFLEDTGESQLHHFDRELEAICQLQFFEHVRGVVFGRTQKASKLTREQTRALLQKKFGRFHIPVVANVDFGHTEPKCTFPIGGGCAVEVQKEMAVIRISEH